MAIGTTNEKIIKLTDTLKKYEQNVLPNVDKFESTKNDIVSQATDAVNDAKAAHDSVLSSGSGDPQIQRACKGLQLITDANNVLLKSMNNDVGGVISSCREVNKIFEDIDDVYKRDGIGTWRESSWIEKVIDGIKGIFVKVENDQTKINQANSDLKRLMNMAETQIKSISESAGAIQLGIVGNMKIDGTLGNYTGYNNTFNREQWEKQNPHKVVQNLNVLQKIGCFAVGAVEGVLKFGEGILDAGATLVGGVVSLIAGEDSGLAKGIRSFVERDLANEAATKIIGLAGIDAEAYNESGARKFGFGVGQAVSHAVAWALPPLGIVAGTLSAAGNTAEKSLKEVDGYGTALLKGLGTGALYYVGGKVVGNVINKVGSWASTSTNFAARGINWVGRTAFGTARPTSLGGKAVRLVTWPARLFQRGVTSISNTISRSPMYIAASGGRIGQAVSRVDLKIERYLGNTMGNTWRAFTRGTGVHPIRGTRTALRNFLSPGINSRWQVVNMDYFRRVGSIANPSDILQGVVISHQLNK